MMFLWDFPSLCMITKGYIVFNKASGQDCPQVWRSPRGLHVFVTRLLIILVGLTHGTRIHAKDGPPILLLHLFRCLVSVFGFHFWIWDTVWMFEDFQFILETSNSLCFWGHAYGHGALHQYAFSRTWGTCRSCDGFHVHSGRTYQHNSWHIRTIRKSLNK